MNYLRPSPQSILHKLGFFGLFLGLPYALLSIPQPLAQVDIPAIKFSGHGQVSLSTEELREINGHWSRLVDVTTSLIERIHGALQKGMIVQIPEQSEIKDAASHAQYEQTIAHARAVGSFLTRMKTELQRYQQEIFIPTPEHLAQRIETLVYGVKMLEKGLETRFAQLDIIENITDEPHIVLPGSAAQLFEYLSVELYRMLTKMETTIDTLGSNRLQRALRVVDEKVLRRVPWHIVRNVGAIALTAYLVQTGLRWYHGSEIPALQHKYDLLNAANPAADDTLKAKLALIQAQEGQHINIASYSAQVAGASLLSLINPASEYNIIAKLTSSALGNYISSTTEKTAYMGKSYVYRAQKWVQKIYQTKVLGNAHTLETQSFYDRSLKLDSPELIGLDNVQQEFEKMIHFLLNADTMLRSGQNIPRTLLLTGPSSCGKTMSMKAFMNTLNERFALNNSNTRVNHITINTSEVTTGSKYEFGTLERLFIGALAGEAHGPTIVFIDEIHLLNLRQDAHSLLLSEFLDILRKLEDIKDPNRIVILVAATNKKEMLAPELRMYGRFSNQIEFKLPGQIERHTYFTHHMKEQGGIELPAEDIIRFVQLTNGCNYGHLQEIMSAARATAMRANRGICAQDIEREIYSKIYGLIDTSIDNLKNRGMSALELQTVAAHQAGKLVAHHVLQPSIECAFASVSRIREPLRASSPYSEYWTQREARNPKIAGIHKSGITYGVCAFVDPHEEITVATKTELTKRAQLLLAGAAAQEVLNGQGASVYGKDDRGQAFELLKMMLLGGIDPDTLSKAQLDDISSKAYEQLQALELETRALLDAHKQLLEKAQRALLSQLVVTPEDITGA